jgi:hypothetical protein
MDDVDGVEAVNTAAAEHVRRLRERLAEGREEIARQQASLSETREHIDGVSRWREQTDRLLAEWRRQRGGEAA